MLSAALIHFDEGDGYNPVQFFVHLRAYTTVQREIVKQAKKEIYKLGF
jgi:hypothetical protein